MPTTRRPRKGSLQFYPRKRAGKFIPRTNWATISVQKEEGVLGFIVYKVGMRTAVVRDSTEKSMTKGKLISIPVTILEAPNMKIYAVRFYKGKKVVKDVVVSNDKELKKILKIQKQIKNFDQQIPPDYDNVHLILYSLPAQTNVKKTPDLAEVAINSKDKLSFVKNILGKEISISQFSPANLIDVHGLTKGKGLVGPMQRFGISKRQHKSEKGVRRPGSLGPWHPARVTFRAPMAGQLGMFTRVTNNLLILNRGSIKEKDINLSEGFQNYGKISSSYIIVKGSVQGPQKRQLLITGVARPSKKQSKTKFEFVELIK